MVPAITTTAAVMTTAHTTPEAQATAAKNSYTIRMGATSIPRPAQHPTMAVVTAMAAVTPVTCPTLLTPATATVTTVAAT